MVVHSQILTQAFLKLLQTDDSVSVEIESLEGSGHLCLIVFIVDKVNNEDKHSFLKRVGLDVLNK